MLKNREPRRPVHEPRSAQYISIPSVMLEHVPEAATSRFVTDCLFCLNEIRNHSDREMRGKFSRAEWVVMIMALKNTECFGTLLYYPNVLAELMEEYLYYQYEGDEDVDVEVLCDKIKSLPSAHVEVIYRRAGIYWRNVADYGEESCSIQEYSTF